MGSESICYFCGASVQPTPQGYCPSCAEPFKTEAEGLAQYEVTPPPRFPKSSNSNYLIKIMMVIFVFPTMARLVSSLIGFVMIMPLYILPKSWFGGWMSWTMVVSNSLGLIGAIFVCRKYWPQSES